eukprot:TRINITY_DN42212_c0_g1_i1.p1 TRINITY_DN42212_c0_g1~~TRINITY_DN42212_c0_g1_i1.p1  ORF type:complete len:469 (-),score=61.43 TRINITY_DN42212_c0_g1_i1:150-1556(-)
MVDRSEFLDGASNLPEVRLPHREPSWANTTHVLLKMCTGEYDAPFAFCSALVKLGAVKDIDELDGLRGFLEERGPELESTLVIRTLASLVLDMPRLFPSREQPVILVQGVQHVRCHLSRKQCAALLACGYLGLIPAQSSSLLRDNGRLSFQFWWHDRSEWEKLACIHTYFAACGRSGTDGGENEQGLVIGRKRKALGMSEWQMCATDLGELHISVEAGAKIEDTVGNDAKIDFANRMIGGGVLRGGKAQEELMFVTHPELIVSLLLVEKLLPEETVEIVGARRHCNYTGYGRSFAFAGKHAWAGTDDHEVGLRVVAMDALFQPMDGQYSEDCLLRELNKAVSGFHPTLDLGGYRCVTTGNWGCGAFGGDHQLKALIQWAAASVAGVELRYLTDGHPALDKFAELTQAMRGSKTHGTVGGLCRALVRHGTAHLRLVKAAVLLEEEYVSVFDALADELHHRCQAKRCALM